MIDRYYYSGCVYSAAKNNPALSLDWARITDVGLPQPDICVFLAISAENASRRGGFGEERYERREMQERVRELFQGLGQVEVGNGECWVEVDGGRGMEVVEAEVLEVVERRCIEVDQRQLPLRFVEAW